jgi:hypothetical protein
MLSYVGGGTVQVYAGTAGWTSISGGGGGGVVVGTAAPDTPAEGDLWWDSDNGKLYVYYEDGTSEQWVDAAGPSVAVQSTAPTGYEGQLWLDDTDGSMYVYYTDPGGANSQWIGAVSRSGGILQVVSTTKTDTFTTTSSTFSDITGLSATITPRSTSSKIYVSVSLVTSLDNTGTGTNFLLLRDSTSIAIGDAAGVRTRVSSGSYGGSANEIYPVAITFLDSPNTTSSTTYKVQIRSNVNTFQSTINRSNGDANGVERARAISVITLMEVAG